MNFGPSELLILLFLLLVFGGALGPIFVMLILFLGFFLLV